jgi:molybdopterin synthase catalytic subunit
MIRAELVDSPIDPSRLLDEVASPGNGASVLFLGTVRDVNQGRTVTGMEYSAYRSMAQREMNAVLAEAQERFGSDDLVVEHRVGTLEIGDISVAIAAAHGHRGRAFEAARYIIEELKKRVPIWKREHYVDGTREWVDPTGAAAPLDQVPQ